MESTHLPWGALGDFLGQEAGERTCFERPARVFIGRHKKTDEPFVAVEYASGEGEKITFPKPRVRVKAISRAA